MATYNFEELTREDGMRTAVSQESGTATAVYRLHGTNDDTPPTVRELASFVPFLCGSVNNQAVATCSVDGEEDAGKVKRTLPKVHPFMADLSIAGVRVIEPGGSQGTGTSAAVLFRDPVTAEFPHFTHYDYHVEFARRPYFLLANSQINRGSGTYTKPDGTTLPYRCAEEWRRFTRFTPKPLPDTVTSRNGTNRFRTATGGAPGGASFTGEVSLYLQNQMLEVDWYCVPLRYLENHTIGSTTYRSYLTRFTNTVNQFDWKNYGKGTLLYLGAEPVQIYTPLVPQVQRILGLGVGIAQDLCCNLKLRFIHTTREGTDVPTTGNGLANANNIAAGHNLEPNFADRTFRYTTTIGPNPSTDTTKWFAKHPSFPFELLFTDPLLVQPGGVI